MADKFDIERKIINSLKLFQGLRAPEEDKKIMDKMLDICKKEMIVFLSENLTSSQVKSFEKDAKEDIEKALSVYVRKIPMGRFRLEERLKYTVDAVLVKAVANNSLQNG